MSKAYCERVRHGDRIENLVKVNEKIQVQNEEMRKKNLEESVQEMEQMTDGYLRVKLSVHHTDTVGDQV